MSTGAYFVDTAYWIALINPRDNYHPKAVELAEVTAGAALVTSEIVLTEVLNAFSGSGPHLRGKAHLFVKHLFNLNYLDIIPFDHTLFRRAFDRYGNYTDKGWGLVDCASFVVMEDHFISEALTTDRHFTQAGYVALMREQ